MSGGGYVSGIPGNYGTSGVSAIGGAAGSALPAVAKSGSSMGSGNYATIFNFWKSKGATDNTAAVMTAAAHVESGGDPTKVNPISGAQGLYQDLGSRQNAATASGSLQANLDNAWKELGPGGPEHSKWSQMQSATSLREAAGGGENFERSDGWRFGNPHASAYDGKFTDAAQASLDRFGGKLDGTSDSLSKFGSTLQDGAKAAQDAVSGKGTSPAITDPSSKSYVSPAGVPGVNNPANSGYSLTHNADGSRVVPDIGSSSGLGSGPGASSPFGSLGNHQFGAPKSLDWYQGDVTLPKGMNYPSQYVNTTGNIPGSVAPAVGGYGSSFSGTQDITSQMSQLKSNVGSMANTTGQLNASVANIGSQTSMLSGDLTKNVPGIGTSMQTLGTTMPQNTPQIGSSLTGLTGSLQSGTAGISGAIGNITSTMNSGAGGIGDAVQNLTKSLSSGGGGGGGFGSLFGGGGGGGMFGGLFGGLFHSGGQVGSPSMSSRWVHPSVFAGARRFHTGGTIEAAMGLKKGEVPIIAKEGEEVLNPADARAYRAGKVGRFTASNVGRPTTSSTSGQGDTHLSVVNHNQTQDAGSFKKAESQIGFETARSLNTQLRRTGNQHQMASGH